MDQHDTKTEPKAAASRTGALLEVRDLRTYFHIADGTARAVDGVSFSLGRGEILGLVGESGCGKSVTALSILGLIPSPPGRIESGEIWFEGRDLLTFDEEAMLGIRGNRIGMIFQEPMTALNPVYTVGDQLAEVFRLHRGASKSEARIEAVGMLEKVRIPEPAARARDFPHHFSGGMLQRAMTAMALACEPDLLLADEPTTALDVTVQAQILELMLELRRDTDAAILIITHDLGVVAEFAEDVVVMYAGQVVESGPTRELFDAPRHPYTRGLMQSLPGLVESGEGARLTAIEGNVPSPLDWPTGCRFSPRCPHAREACRKPLPANPPTQAGRRTQCLFADEIFS